MFENRNKNMKALGFIIFLLWCNLTKCDHFGGGVFMWAPLNGGNSVKVTMRLTWSSGHAQCSDTAISSGTLTGSSASISCSGCTASSLGAYQIRCQDFMTVSWGSGENNFTINTSTFKQFTFWFTGGAWFNLLSGGSTWYLSSTVDLATRQDTGGINSSPTVNMPSVLYWQTGCSYTYTLPVHDVDGDVIRCRWASGSTECADVCRAVAFPGASLNEATCTISYTTDADTGFYAVAIQVEDFMTTTSTTPLSSIPVQFMVNIYSGSGCSDASQFIDPTPSANTKFVTDIGSQYNFTIKVQGPQSFLRLVILSELEISQSSTNSSTSSWHNITISATWTPSSVDADTDHRVCFYARDSIGVTSETRCIVLHATEIDECGSNPCKNNGTCTDFVNFYNCSCQPGYQGIDCENETDECESSPCQNGGTCNDYVNFYNCSCSPGYEGINCDEETDECDSSPCKNDATCNDYVNFYNCSCPPGYEGINCEEEIDECRSNQCKNNGTCTDYVNFYNCSCQPGYQGIDCENETDECDSSPCQNGGTCNDYVNFYNCSCPPGYEGINCDEDIDECRSNPCKNNGTCNDYVNFYNCSCQPGYQGINCENETDECDSSPCKNGATCNDYVNFYNCSCPSGYEGINCEEDIDECRSNPCKNNGTCFDYLDFYNCSCQPGYQGINCKNETDECASSPCKNGATCYDYVNFYNCSCPPGFEGINCEEDIDECRSNPCKNNGTCTDYANFYNCSCQPGYQGINCENETDECDSSPCRNGATCNDYVNFYNCSCPPGYEGINCEEDIDECRSNPCKNNGTCTDYVNFYNCSCQPGYQGVDCENETNECDSSPCKNGATCNDYVNFYNCSCPPGFDGINCEEEIDECSSNPCKNNGNCTDFVNFYNCSCQPGYQGINCENETDECGSSPCQNGGTCSDYINFYNCSCSPGYEGINCEAEIDECRSNPCKNNGTCNDFVNFYNCSCQPGYQGINCENETDECDSSPCKNGATCNDYVNFYNCYCPPGYEGINCEEEIDECRSNPCKNNGNCTDFVNFYNCSCQPGYQGINCENETDECESSPCQNGGTCTDFINFYNCSCSPGYEGIDCEAEIDECRSNPCKNNGTCTNFVNFYNCSCQPGYQGIHCENETDECDSSPCKNGATCNDYVNFYNCSCPPGYEGINCEEEIDECRSNPCKNNGNCTDFVNFYNCSCQPGYQGINCENETDECGSSPCQNGGTCTDYINFYNCSCSPGYEGINCEAEIDECRSNPCKNNGTCTDFVNFYNCSCQPGYQGIHCENETDECDSSPCKNGATCNDYVNFYNCSCSPGYEGINCEDEIDECRSNPCKNNGNCTDYVNFYNCSCQPGYQGINCENETDECESSPCQNGGTCTDYINFYNCSCSPGYEGINCEAEIDECRSNPCKNNGTCTDFVNFYNCSCQPGYQGINCENETDECDSSPCKNGATCNDYVNFYNCSCPAGYEGINCEDEIDECRSNPCKNNGTCNDYVNIYNCSCQPGYQGINCENETNECESYPCKNGGTCNDYVNFYNCSCLLGYVGINCEAYIGICNSNLCKNDGTCLDYGTFYNCSCQPGYEGINCEHEIDKCRNNPCKNNGTCNNYVTSYNCSCLPGYEGLNCEKAVYGAKCRNAQMCLTKGAKCINKTCSCATNHYDAELDLCDTMPLYPYGMHVDDNLVPIVKDSCSDAVVFDQGIPIFDEIHTKLFVCSNGHISFDKPFISPVPPKNVKKFSNKTIVAPYFADTGAGNMSFRHFDVLNSPEGLKQNDTKDVESVIQDIEGVKEFDAKFILFATWENVSPFQKSLNNVTNATFQIVIATNGMDTYALFLYGYNMMGWKFVSAKNEKPDIWIGFSASGVYHSTNINSFKRSALEIDKNAVTNGISGLLFERLTQVGTKQPNYAISCIDWYNKNKHLEAEIRETSDKMPECPCSLDSLGFDPWFWGSSDEMINSTIYSVQILPSQLFKPYGKTCLYNMTTGLWINEIPEAGGFNIHHPDLNARGHTENDLNAKISCCEKSKLCNLYYKLHPVGSCYNETWFELGTTWGDPHFKTLDGNNYTFNGLGEFTLLKMDNGFKLQARTRRAVKDDGNFSDATIFTAFAASDSSGAAFHVELNDAENGLTLYANDVDLSLLFKKVDVTSFRYRTNESNLALVRKEDTLVVFFPSVAIALNITVGVKMLSMNTIVPKVYRNMTAGLLGNFDGLADNDFIAPNGTNLGSNLNDSEIHQFGLLWLVSGNNTSVFKYFDNNTSSDYSNKSYIPSFLDTVDPAKIEEAVKLCEGLQNIQCVFDFVFTDNENVANDTKKRKNKADETDMEIRKVTPSLKGCDVLYILDRSEQISCSIEVLGDTDNDLVFNFTDNTANAIFNQTSRNLMFMQTSFEPVKISITVIKDGRKAIPFTVNVRFCSGCNEHGNCTNKTRSDQREAEYFKYLECVCEPQYEGDDCEQEFDGCASNPCSVGRNCTKLTALEQKKLGKSYNCSACPDGFIEDGDKCLDIDECAAKSNLCEHTCLNVDGSYECLCNIGYRTSSTNNSLCNDINECDESIHNCSQLCENVNGGFKCSCFAGFTFNNVTWNCDKDVKAACTETKIINCSHTAGCTVDEISLNETCFCENGFELSTNGTACIDIDECERNVCPQTCVNTFGGVQCLCYSGFERQEDLSCKECEFPYWGDGCSNECKCSGRGATDCNTVRGCICKDGWHGDTCDTDINECDILVDPCQDVKKECINEPGSYSCRCKEGYTENDGECQDIDECSSLVLNDCEGFCINTIGGYSCGCSEGLTIHENTLCKDIDECALDLDDCEQRCLNFKGLYNCFCHFGYHLNDDRKTCKEVDNPCKEELNLNCSHFCVKTEISAKCECRNGFKIGADHQTCLDIDECSSADTNDCTDGAECINTDGSYECKCPLGSKLENDDRTCSECDEYHYGNDCSESCNCINGDCDRKTGCICESGWFGKDCDRDINECSSTLCSGDNKQCINTPGSYKCVCKLGYTNESGECKDIDECSDVRLNTCDQTCINNVGSYVCSCQQGFAFINGQCSDIDECLVTAKCHQICENTVGSYRCSCEEGFKLDLTNRQSCTPNNLCNMTEVKECIARNAQCKITDTNADCYCSKGFVLNDEGVCEDIKECSRSPSPCFDKECQEEEGGFRCICEPGSFLLQDGTTCQVCEKTKFGPECNSTCNCLFENTKSCDPINGDCDCLTGWQGDTCPIDVNECTNETLFKCPEKSKCVNTNGSYICECDIGNIMTGDERCEECDRQHFGLNCESECKCITDNTENCNNTDGTCMCNKGWTGETCDQDINECLQSEDVCSVKANAECRNTNGSYQCDCKEGYFPQNNNCIDKDECNDGTANCKQECVNTDGDYVCKCSAGYRGSWNNCTECSDNQYGINCTHSCECNATNVVDAEHSCNTTTGKCFCKSSWQGDTCNNDVNECENVTKCNDDENTGCNNLIGSYVCDCLRGFLRNGEKCVIDAPAPLDIPENFGVINLVTRLDVDLSEGTNLNTSTTYEVLKLKVTYALLPFHRRYAPDGIEIVILDIRLGSLIVNYSIIYDTMDPEIRNNLVRSAIDLEAGATLEFDGNPVQARAESTGNYTDPCEMYLKLVGPCSKGFECIKENERPMCREILKPDNFSLYLSVSISAGFLFICILIFIFCIRTLRKRRKLEKAEKHLEHMNRIHRDSDENKDDIENVLRRDAKITLKPQIPMWDEKGKTWVSMALNMIHNQRFGTERVYGRFPHRNTVTQPHSIYSNDDTYDDLSAASGMMY